MTVKQPTVLFLFLGALCIFAAASPSTPRENIPVNSEVFVQPEYIEALDKELEREGLAALQAQEVVGTSNSNGPGYSHNKKFASQRKLELPKMGPADRFSERVLYPAEVLGLSESKRNFDEIDRSGFSGFNKRNFDEIDRAGFSGFNKRNMDEIDRSAFSGFNKRNFDEIDRSGFSGFKKRNFDEIDRSGFSGFTKRNLDKIDRNGSFSTFNRKRNFDEIDRSGFSGFSKRNFDEIDRSGVPGFTKRSISNAKAASRAVNRVLNAGSNQRRR